MDLTKTQEFIQSQLKGIPEIAIVLGSGLGDFVKIIDNKVELNFSEIPGYLLPTVQGHKGKLILGSIDGKSIICSQGRFHFYEGFSIDEVTFPIQLFKNLGCEKLIITNSSGCLQKNWNIGGFMNISSLLDFTFQHSKKPIKTNLTSIIDLNSIKNSLNDNIDIYDGCYTWTLGPTYETPSEIHEIREHKGDIVGMSTYPEIQKAIELGLNVVGIACLTNYAAGVTKEPLTHQEVVSSAKIASLNFCKLINVIINQI